MRPFQQRHGASRAGQATRGASVCKWCNERPSASELQLCNFCEFAIRDDIKRRMQIIGESFDIVNGTKYADTKRRRLELIVQQTEQLEKYEQKGIPTMEPLPSDVRYVAHAQLQGVLASMVTRTSGMISVGPALDIGTSLDAEYAGIQGAQWSSVDDACPLCKFLDGMTMEVDNPDFETFRPPLHDGCKCIRIYVGAGQTIFESDWERPPYELLRDHAPHLMKLWF